MRMTRCEACGAKALMAASQCPKCGDYLGLRDEHGDFVAMARCPSCECYYPRRRGGCRWCGTTPPPSMVPKFAMAAAGVVLLAGVAWGIGRIVGGSGEPAEPSSGGVIAAASTTAPETPARAESSERSGRSDGAAKRGAATDRATTADKAGKSAPTTTPAPPRDQQTRQVASGATADAPSAARSTVPEAGAAERPRQAAAAASQRDTVTPAPSPSGWSETSPSRPVNTIVVAQDQAADSVVPVAELIARPDSLMPREGDEGIARTWVNVRAGTGKDAEVVGVITPDTPVRFGERRGSWIRVSTAALSGWADRRLFAVNR